MPVRQTPGAGWASSLRAGRPLYEPGNGAACKPSRQRNRGCRLGAIATWQRGGMIAILAA